MNLQIIEINRIYKVILIESCLIVSLEFINIMIQPDWLAEIELITDRIQRIKNLVCSGVVRIIADHGVTQHIKAGN